MQLIKILYLSFSGLLLNSVLGTQQQDQRVFFCYGDLYPGEIKGYEYVVVEPVHFSSSDIETLKKNNKRVLGYISLGEVNEAAPYFHELKDVTLNRNEFWNSHVLDLSNRKTVRVLMEQISRILQEKGFDGLFLDNVDNFTRFGPTPQKKQDLLQFLRILHEKYPDIFVLQNAGIEIIDDTAPYVDAVAVESVATAYDFSTSEYRLREQEQFESLLKELRQVKKRYDLPIIFVEYAISPPLKKAVLNRITPTGWPHFIGSIELQCIR